MAHTFRRLVAAVRRFWWFVLVVALLAVLGAVVSTARTPTAYLARTSLVVASQGASPNQDAVLAQGYIAYFNDRSYQQQLVAEAGVGPGVTVAAQAAAQSPIVVITASGADAGAAQLNAIAVARAYRDDVNAVRSRAREAQLASLNDQLDAVLARGSKADPDIVIRLQDQIHQLEADRTGELQELQADGGVAVRTPHLLSNVVLGLVGGLLAGVLAALALATLSTRLRTADDLAQKVGLRTLVELPGPRARGGAPLRAERLRRLANLVRARLGGPGVVLVTSAGEAAGTAVVALELASELATQGYPTVLVRVGSGGQSSPGHALEPKAALSHLVAGPVPGMSVLDLKPRQAEAETTLPASRLPELLDLGRRTGSVVVLEVDDVVRSAAAQTASPAADAVLLVIDPQQAEAAEAREAAALVRQAGGAFLGAVLAPAVTDHDLHRPGVRDGSALSRPAAGGREGEHARGGALPALVTSGGAGPDADHRTWEAWPGHGSTQNGSTQNGSTQNGSAHDGLANNGSSPAHGRGRRLVHRSSPAGVLRDGSRQGRRGRWATWALGGLAAGSVLLVMLGLVVTAPGRFGLLLVVATVAVLGVLLGLAHPVLACGYLLLTTFFRLAIPSGTLPVDPFLLAFAGVLASTVVRLAPRWRRPLSLRLDPVLCAIALYVAWNVVSMVLPHEYPAGAPLDPAPFSLSRFVLIGVAMPMAMFLVGRWLFVNQRAIRILLWSLLAAATYSALVSILQFTAPALVWPRYILTNTFWPGRAVGVFNQPLVNGLVLIVGFSVAILLASHRAEPRFLRTVAGLVALASAWGVYLTHTRTVWLAFVLVVLLGAVIAPRLRRGFVLTLVVIVLGVAVNWSTFTSADRSAGGVGSPDEVQDRLNTIATSGWAFLQKPVTGWGIGRFAAVNTYHHQQYSPQIPWERGFGIPSHLDALGVLVELGIVGLALWAVVLVLVYRDLVRATRALPAGSMYGRPLGLTALLCLVAQTISGLTVDLRFFDFPNIVVMMLAGAVIGLQRTRAQETPPDVDGATSRTPVPRATVLT